MDISLIVPASAVAFALFVVWLLRHPATVQEDGAIYYDEDEVLPPCPQPWGRDDYKPWPGVYDD